MDEAILYAVAAVTVAVLAWDVFRRWVNVRVNAASGDMLAKLEVHGDLLADHTAYLESIQTTHEANLKLHKVADTERESHDSLLAELSTKLDAMLQAAEAQASTTQKLQTDMGAMTITRQAGPRGPTGLTLGQQGRPPSGR